VACADAELTATIQAVVRQLLILTLVLGSVVSSSAETDRVLNTALIPELQTTLRVGELAVLRIPSDHEYSIVSAGNVLVPVRRSQVGVIYRAVRRGQQTILLTPHVSEGDCVSCATHHYFITVVPRR
jgi:hypothetical protein